MSGSRLLRGGTRMMEWSGGLKPSAVAGKLSVTRLTHSSCTGISASGMPSRTVRKMLTTSPMFEETEEKPSKGSIDRKARVATH